MSFTEAKPTHKEKKRYESGTERYKDMYLLCEVLWWVVSAWCVLGAAKTVACIPWVNLCNRYRLDGSYVCPNHKQELSSVYQFIDVLYNLRWMLSSSSKRLMEFYDPLVIS